MKQSTIRRIIVAVVLLVAGYVAYDMLVAPYDVMADGRAALVSNDRVSVQTEPYLVFTPVGQEPKAGLVFYIGARVPPAAYAPLGRDVAAQGYLVAIPNMPLNYSVFGQGVATDVFDDHPAITSWAVGGHSLGGTMAASYAHRSPIVDGLLLVAAYPETSVDFDLRSDLRAAVVYATQDERATVEEVEAAAGRLPEDTEWILIQGGNHAQFGWYGLQPGDGAAMIPRIDQHAQTVDATIDLLRAID